MGRPGVFRIFLFLLTNLAVLLVAGIVLNLLGFNGYMDSTGTDLNLTALLIFCGIFGMSGSMVSLFISKWMAKRATGARRGTRSCSECGHGFMTLPTK